MKKFVAILLLCVGNFVYGQNEIWPPDSVMEVEGEVVPVYTKEYLIAYNRMKRMIVKVYPYALHAADVIDKIDENAEQIKRRRKKNAFYKASYKLLKEDFKYFILDLYTSEGQMLMKLVHRETGMTVYEISNKYRGGGKAQIFNMMAKVWDQDLKIKFDPAEGDDKIAEQVIQDIQAGLVPFNNEVVTIDKLTYRDQIKAEKAKKKEYKKRNKAYEKNKKKRLKEKAKKEKQKQKNDN